LTAEGLVQQTHLSVSRGHELCQFAAQSLLLPRSDAIIAADRGGIIRFWNPGAERIFGHIRDDAIGLSLDLIIPERLRQRHWDGYRRTMESGKSRYGEGDTLSVPALHKNGRTISVEFIIIPLRDESGGMIGMAAIMSDVTKRIEEVRALKRRLVEATKPQNNPNGG
jgi:PAS domain S-box-containing protein